MRREQKILVTILWGLTVLAMIGVVGAGLWARREDAAPEILFDAPAFSLTDQNDQTVTDASLRGNVWIGMLFFTNCPGVCPMMTAKMANLQKQVLVKDVKIVSFSVDPENDKPATMRAYAEKFGADQSRWHMLTGPKDTMFQVARGLGLAAQPAREGEAIIHSQKVLLIDRQNHVRGIYDTNDDDSMTRLADDAKKLAAETRGNAVSGQTDPKEFLAALNAALNGTSAVLLVIAYIMIRLRSVRAHATLMVTALVTSSVFLGFYLYSHYMYGERSSGIQPGLLRTFYFLFLAAHVILAVLMLPPIFVTVWLAYKRSWVWHRRVARPTFWVWLYVSVSGVMIYALLYHLFPAMAATR